MWCDDGRKIVIKRTRKNTWYLLKCPSNKFDSYAQETVKPWFLCNVCMNLYDLTLISISSPSFHLHHSGPSAILYPHSVFFKPNHDLLFFAFTYRMVLFGGVCLFLLPWKSTHSLKPRSIVLLLAREQSLLPLWSILVYLNHC